ncbi:cytochrome P450 [Daldinia loculata]|nr:cytochrome P450 [Daldinia loculata]
MPQAARHVYQIFIRVLIVHSCIRFLNNLREAQRSRLPYTWSLVSEHDPFAWVTNALLRWWYKEYLHKGEGWPRWARFMIIDWQYEDRRRATLEFGDCFLLVTPSRLICYVSDPDTVSQLFMRRKAVIKPPEKMKILAPFGRNISMAEGDLWKFHLGIVLPPLAAESVARLVWDETSRQVDMTTATWKPSSSNKERIYSLTMNTMLLVGFGRQAQGDSENQPSKLSGAHQYSLVDAMTNVTMYLPHILLLPRWLLRWSPWPIAYQCANEVDSYIDELVAEAQEKLLEDSTEAQRETLITAILRSNMAAENDKKHIESIGRSTLTNEEIRGNAYIFLIAGYDTTANTTLFTMLVLIAHRDLQERLIEEIDTVYAQAAKEGRLNLSHAEDFPRFRYLVAFMYEVMRIFPIVPTLARVAFEPQQLSGYTLPGKTSYITNTPAIHYDPSVWPSPEIIEPRRWLVADPHSFDPCKPLTAAQETEIRNGTTAIPGNRKGTFLTFGEGPRACLGCSFARVEYVSLISRLLRRHRLEIADNDVSKAARALRTALLRSGGSPVTLTPPEDIPVLLIPRE